MTTQWNGDARLAEMKKAAAEGLLAAAVLYRGTLMNLVSTPSPFFVTAKEDSVSKARNHLTPAEAQRRGMAVLQSSKRRGVINYFYRVYFNPSKRGEYAKLRTGDGQKGLLQEPLTWQNVVQSGFVRVGYTINVEYMLDLEMKEGRLGMLAALELCRPQMAALATAAFKGG